MKPKLSVYLSDHVAGRLALAAKRPGANKSAIVDAALDRFLNPERDPSGDAALVRRLDRINRQLDRVDRDVGIVAETLALYVRYHLTITPPLPLSDQEAARALGRDRFEMFVAQVGRRVASGNRLVAELVAIGEQEADALRTLLVDQRQRIEKRERAFDDWQLSLEFDQVEAEQLRRDRRRWQSKYERLARDIATEPERVRRGYNVVADLVPRRRAGTNGYACSAT